MGTPAQTINANDYYFPVGWKFDQVETIEKIYINIPLNNSPPRHIQINVNIYKRVICHPLRSFVVKPSFDMIQVEPNRSRVGS